MIDLALDGVNGDCGTHFNYQATIQVVAIQCPCVALSCHLSRRPRDSVIVLSYLASSLSQDTQTIVHSIYNLNNNIYPYLFRKTLFYQFVSAVPTAHCIYFYQPA